MMRLTVFSQPVSHVHDKQTEARLEGIVKIETLIDFAYQGRLSINDRGVSKVNDPI